MNSLKKKNKTIYTKEISLKEVPLKADQDLSLQENMMTMTEDMMIEKMIEDNLKENSLRDLLNHKEINSVRIYKMTMDSKTEPKDCLARVGEDLNRCSLL